MKKNGGFFASLLYSVLINLEWTIPAWILLAVHFIFDWSILWFWIALGVWALGVVLWAFIMPWAAKCSNEPDPPKENKNPYSVGNKKENNGVNE